MAAQKTSDWAVGWSLFAGVMLIVAGGFQVMAGLAALVNNEFFVVTPKYIFQFNVTTWGWIHLLLGVVLLLAGIGIFAGNVLARTVGVIVAVVSALAAFGWLPWYPVWAILIIALDVAVIWALTLHGRDIAE